MALRSITARFECDGCAKVVEIYMDPATEVNRASLFDAAENALFTDFLQMEKVEGGRHLCNTCVDREFPEEEDSAQA